MGERWILSLVGLDCFLSGIRRLATMLAAADICSHWELREILSPPDSLPLLLQICDTDHCEWWDLIYHCLSTGISAAIRSAEHLVWWGRFVFVCFFFSLKGVRTITFGYSWKILAVFGIYFSGAGPRTAVIHRTSGLVNWGACELGWSNCSSRKCPQGGSTFQAPLGAWRQPEP